MSDGTEQDLVYLPDSPSIPAPGHAMIGGYRFARSSSLQSNWPQYHLIEDTLLAEDLAESYEYLKRVPAADLAQLDDVDDATEAILGGEFDNVLDAIAWYEREGDERQSVLEAIRQRSNQILADVTPTDVDPATVATR